MIQKFCILLFSSYSSKTQGNDGKLHYRYQEWIYWGGGGLQWVHTLLALARWGAGGGAIFMIKQKNIRDIMKYTL